MGPGSNDLKKNGSMQASSTKLFKKNTTERLRFAKRLSTNLKVCKSHHEDLDPRIEGEDVVSAIFISMFTPLVLQMSTRMAI